MKFSAMVQPKQISPTAAAAASDAPNSRRPDVPLSAMVPPEVRRAVRRAAADKGTTVRSVLLHALRQAGIADIDDAEVTDRRAMASGRRQSIAQAADKTSS
jgi:hypothetical protein